MDYQVQMFCINLQLLIHPGGGQQFFGFKAVLDPGAKVTIRATITSGDVPLIGFQDGWTYINGATTNEKWYYTEEDSADAEYWLVSAGSATIDYWENGIDTLGTPTFTKNITW